LAAACLGLCVAPAASAAPSAPRDWLGLAGGEVGAFHWTVEAKRPDGPAGEGSRATRRPCLLVGTTWRISPYSYRRSQSRQCAGRDGLSPSEPPLVARGALPSSGAPTKLTAIGMFFAPAARRLEATLADGSHQAFHLKRLNTAQSRRAHLAPFRYVAFAARGEWCAERLVVENGSGRVLWDSGVDAYACGDANGPPRFAG
jgi:hypothetical protein